MLSVFTTKMMPVEEPQTVVPTQLLSKPQELETTVASAVFSEATSVANSADVLASGWHCTNEDPL